MPTRSKSLAVLVLALAAGIWALQAPRADQSDEAPVPAPIGEQAVPRPMEQAAPLPPRADLTPDSEPRDPSFRWIDGRDMPGFEPGGCVLPVFNQPARAGGSFPGRPAHR